MNRHLEKLDISWNGFHIRGALTLSKALEINTTLLDLNLSCNRLSDGCIQILVNGLKKNSNLKVLRVSWNSWDKCKSLCILLIDNYMYIGVFFFQWRTDLESIRFFYFKFSQSAWQYQWFHNYISTYREFKLIIYLHSKIYFIILAYIQLK